MSSLNGIFWLASYPKSGNTWFRIVLANVLNKTNQPVNLNAINTGGMASDRGFINKALGFNSTWLTQKELLHLRPAIYTWYGKQKNGVQYFKLHDAYVNLANNTPLFPTEGCLGVLYFIRNPLDVVISFANHTNNTLDETIDMLDNPNLSAHQGSFRATQQIPQHFSSWSSHVRSWVDSPFHVLVVRYEDMYFNPFNTFNRALHFLCHDVEKERLQQAIDQASFATLQQQEKNTGFKEKPPIPGLFFRKGIVGDWESTLSPVQVQRVIDCHGDMMQQYGYVDEQGQPIRYHS